jgi:hypothetical protein
VRAVVDQERTRVAAFIDELDHILDFDRLQEFELMHTLRATFDHHNCRLFFAGFRRTMEARRDINHPLFNFTHEVALEALSADETIEMVTEPLEALGAPVGKTDLPATIYRETAGHPELIQFYCEELLTLQTMLGRLPTPTQRNRFQQSLFPGMCSVRSRTQTRMSIAHVSC